MEFEEVKKSYFAIIPANVRYDSDLPANAKLLYGEITCLCSEKGCCWAKNDYFANLYGVSKSTISRWISLLVKKGYIEIEIEYKEGTKEIVKRSLRVGTYVSGKEEVSISKSEDPVEKEEASISESEEPDEKEVPVSENEELDEKEETSIQNCEDPIPKNDDTYTQNCAYPIRKNAKENNTSINNIKKKIYKRKKSEPKPFKPPTIEEITQYCEERKNNVDPKAFYNFYSKAEWLDSRGKLVKNWKLKMVQIWENSEAPQTNGRIVFKEPTYDDSKNIEATPEQIEEFMKMRRGES